MRIVFISLVMCTVSPAASVWSGVYTAAQATRGEAAYALSCSSCHRPDLTGYEGLLAGRKFMDHWREDNLASFYQLMKTTMPRSAPAALSDGTYLDIAAFILQSNGFPAGHAELSLDALNGIQIEGKDGPAPVPEFSLVGTVGCLVQDATGEWILDRASVPARTRNPKRSTPEELKIAAGLSGSGVVHFLHLMPYDAVTFKLPEQKGLKVEAKGFLIRKGGTETLNLTSINAVSPGCSR